MLGDFEIGIINLTIKTLIYNSLFKKNNINNFNYLMPLDDSLPGAGMKGGKQV
jgi:hypothetical protein